MKRVAHTRAVRTRHIRTLGGIERALLHDGPISLDALALAGEVRREVALAADELATGVTIATRLFGTPVLMQPRPSLWPARLVHNNDGLLQVVIRTGPYSVTTNFAIARTVMHYATRHAVWHVPTPETARPAETLDRLALALLAPPAVVRRHGVCGVPRRLARVWLAELAEQRAA